MAHMVAHGGARSQVQSGLLIMDFLYNGPIIIMDLCVQVPISDNVLHAIMTESRYNGLSSRSTQDHYEETSLYFVSAHPGDQRNCNSC